MKSVEKWVVYVLKNPRTGEVRYVGWTSRSIKLRLKAHIDSALASRRERGSHKNRWVLSLLSIGLRPELNVIETGTGDGWGEAERRWIAYYRARNANLLNRSDGGEGNPGCAFSVEARRKISETAKSWKRSPEHMAKWHAAGAAAARGRAWTPERKKEQSERLRGVPRPIDVVEKWHAKLRANGYKKSPETRAKIGAKHKGLKASTETRLKMSESRKRFNARQKELKDAA